MQFMKPSTHYENIVIQLLMCSCGNEWLKVCQGQPQVSLKTSTGPSSFNVSATLTYSVITVYFSWSFKSLAGFLTCLCLRTTKRKTHLMRMWLCASRSSFFFFLSLVCITSGLSLSTVLSQVMRSLYLLTLCACFAVFLPPSFILHSVCPGKRFIT